MGFRKGLLKFPIAANVIGRRWGIVTLPLGLCDSRAWLDVVQSRIKQQFIAILSLDVRGFAVEGKFGWVKEIYLSERPFVATFQETRCHTVSDQWVESLWGNGNFGYIQKEVIGKSGGLLLIWDKGCFKVSNVMGNEFFLAIRGKWKSNGQESLIVNIYGPHDDEGKSLCWILWIIFWEKLTQHGHYPVISIRFISRNKLIEIPISGKQFTRISDDGTKFIKLDRFLVTDKFLNLWDDLSIIALDRKLSDHVPLVLRDKVIDYGPKPFKVFDVWFDKEEAGEIIAEAWSMPVWGFRKDCIFRDKLKNVKACLKNWSIKNFGALDSEINSLRKEASEWENKAEINAITDNERSIWLECRRKWIEKEKIKSNMLRQKARIRWILEGDENSKKIHSSIRRKYNKCNIRGLNINGVWNDDPSVVKNTIFTHHRKLFCENNTIRPFLVGQMFSNLGLNAGNSNSVQHNRSSQQAHSPDLPSNSNGPGSSSLGCLSVSDSKVAPLLVGHEQSAFIKGRNILDGVLIANETLEYLKRNKLAILVFKVDFEKAFDSLNWNFLLEMMKIMGFEEKWRNWILSCLRSASISILGLNWLTKAAVRANLFAEVEVGVDNIPISHLQYANDTIFFGKWGRNNMENLMKLLKCFELASELNINYHKSNLFGVGVGATEVEELARFYGCNVGKFPCMYLGLPVGAKMNKSFSIVFLFALPCSVFRASQLESVRRNFFWGGSGEGSKIPWVKWENVIRPFEEGGLNVGSLKAFNLALIDKWWRRFLTETTSLWVKVIKSIYGSSGLFKSGVGGHLIYLTRLLGVSLSKQVLNLIILESVSSRLSKKRSGMARTRRFGLTHG
ncbi:uncharacterized protein [Rutidosis leptorrhynchoides]|uniref:uncharacterized protein n=1 Tax=Rutidosis leptorrhynchoides TaxID=125765 RepID=UPI003A998F37